MQRSLTLLVRYRSRRVLSLPSQCLGDSREISNPRYSGTGAHRTGLYYGTVTLFRAPFQGTSHKRSGAESQPIHHIAERLRFGLCRVHSRLLTTSQLRSLPAGTKMFQFPAFPIAHGNCDGDSHLGIPGSSPPCGSPGLIAAWHARRRLPSRAIHRLACSHASRLVAMDPMNTGPVDVWIARTRGLITRPSVADRVRPFPFTLSRNGASVSDPNVSPAPT